MRAIGGVLFDLDGVLVDSRRAWFDVLNALLAEDGLPPVDPSTFDASFGQSSEADAERFFAGRISTAELDARYDAAFPDHVGAVTLADLDAPRVLADLHHRGIRTAVVTNAPGQTSRAMLAATGLTGLLETIVTPSDVARPKPAPDMLRVALERLGLTPGEAVLVGDSTSDAGAGRAAGVEVIGFRHDIGDHRIDALGDLERWLSE